MLVQAAQSGARHPGPLGHFFRKLSKRKKYNVALVAVARKMVVIAWQMLTHNEPYRYATPQRTGLKLARLRVKATGQRRRSGATKGVPRATPQPSSGRRETIKSLPRICLEEGLPSLQELTPGELRTVQESGATEYVASTRRDHVVERPRRASKSRPTSGS